MRSVCSIICWASPVSSLSLYSSRIICARQAIPVMGLPISCATPAARRPIDASLSLWVSPASRISVSVISSIKMIRPSLLLPVSPLSSMSALCRLTVRLAAASSKLCLYEWSMSSPMNSSSRVSQGSGRSSSCEPTTSALLISVNSSSARFHMIISRSELSEQTPSGKSKRIWR